MGFDDKTSAVKFMSVCYHFRDEWEEEVEVIGTTFARNVVKVGQRLLLKFKIQYDKFRPVSRLEKEEEKHQKVAAKIKGDAAKVAELRRQFTEQLQMKKKPIVESEEDIDPEEFFKETKASTISQIKQDKLKEDERHREEMLEEEEYKQKQFALIRKVLNLYTDDLLKGGDRIELIEKYMEDWYTVINAEDESED